jgi:hypothetical protein
VRADDGFEVGLSFGGVPSILVSPFGAVTDFVDPAVDFSLKFQANGAPEGHEEHDEPGNDLPIAEPIEVAAFNAPAVALRTLSPPRFARGAFGVRIFRGTR